MPKSKNEENEAAPESLSFEKALERLEELVSELESGELTLDESLARHEEGRKVIGQCYRLLENAEKRIEQVVQGEDGSMATKPYEGEVPETGEEEE